MMTDCDKLIEIVARMEGSFDKKIHDYVNDHCDTADNKVPIKEKFKAHVLSRYNTVKICKVLNGDLPMNQLTNLDKLLIQAITENIGKE